ncbi:membrane protein insertase YidC [Allobranchiibius huperziae]|uniref:Membrane protein insertase YidC n=1 Tax=Allobranchiibius huperziae TaxID=1874116 RepID=A0A853DI10_9MICO|nr:membrane protein insertase YidC [Allobranchiibius huperziae]NYJ76317.1 YidC/Oxa1 family membrane protein insertase [Allobranchiibius huperziae]
MIDTLLFPLEWFVALVMVGFHNGLSKIGMNPTSGWTWAFSVVGLVIVLRVLLIPLFVKQIKTSRRMQLIQPEIQAIQKKYKGKKDAESRQKMTEETMELYKRTGTNPFSSCMPILLQAPFFFALFRVLNNLGKIGDGRHKSIGLMTHAAARQAEQSTLFGAKLSDTFLGSHSLAAKVLTMGLIVLMSATMFITQRQLMQKNMPAAALDNPMAKQQKIIMYVMPLFFFVTGPNFPIGVLIYWLTTNLWTMGQQFYVIRRMPAPGSAAEKALEERRRAKGKPMPGAAVSLDKAAAVAAAEAPAEGEDAAKPKVSGQRVQPKKGKRRPTPSTGQPTDVSSNGTSGGSTTAVSTSGDTKITTTTAKNVAPPRAKTKRKR